MICWLRSKKAVVLSVDDLSYYHSYQKAGYPDKLILDENGDVKHIAETDHVYDEINFVRKLLDEDLMNPEFFTMDSTRAEEVSKTITQPLSLMYTTTKRSFTPVKTGFR